MDQARGRRTLSPMDTATEKQLLDIIKTISAIIYYGSTVHENSRYLKGSDLQHVNQQTKGTPRSERGQSKPGSNKS
jgi:hypothetical protein